MGTATVFTCNSPAAAETEPAAAGPACAGAGLISWPGAFNASRDFWPAPRIAARLTALAALGDAGELTALWESLSLPGQVNVLAALAAQAKCSVLDAQRFRIFSPPDLSALQGSVCPGILIAAEAAVAGEWQIPACPACLRTAAETLAELHIANRQAITCMPRNVIAHILTR